MESSLLIHEKELKHMIDLDNVLLDTIVECAKNVYRKTVERIDDLIARYRDRALSITHRRETWYRTRLGLIRITRRRYRYPDGSYHYPLDELLGMEKYRHTTAAVHTLVVDLASQMPFRRSAEVVHKTTSVEISYKTIHRMLQKVAERHLAQWDHTLQWFLHTGALPESEEKKVDHLLVEADGTMLSLQREKARKAEAKAGIVYEGWEQVGKDRYRTVNKSVYMDIAHGDTFWAGMTLKLHEKYKLEHISDVIIGGDGASWIKDGVSYLGGRYQLCRYHLNRELCAALGHDKPTMKLVQQACHMGNTATALKLLDQAAHKAPHDKAKAIKKVTRYICSNATGLTDYRREMKLSATQLRRTGAIEGNIDKLVAKRMKNQGMSWTINGIRHMLCVRSLVLEGKLADYCTPVNPAYTPSTPHGKRINRVIDKMTQQNYEQYFSSGLPALYGPHASRSWVKLLKSLTGVSI